MRDPTGPWRTRVALLRRAPRPRVRRRQALSLIELLIVVALVAAVTGIGSIYYRGLMAEANEERARADMRTLAKGILKLESDQQVTIRPGGPHPTMEPKGLGVNDSPPDEWNPAGGFTLSKLLDFRIVTAIPDDPYGFPYRLDIPGGNLICMGSDGMLDTGDDIRIAFRPPFTVKGARFIESRRAVEIEFSRKIDPFSLFATTAAGLHVALVPVTPTIITTASRHITNPFAVLGRLNAAWPTATPAWVSVQSHIVGTTGVQAMDTAFIGGSYQVEIKDF